MADSTDIRRLVERRLVTAGKDSSPSSIDTILQRLHETNDPEFARKFLDSDELPVPDWVPDVTEKDGLGRAAQVAGELGLEATLIPKRLRHGLESVADWALGTEMAPRTEADLQRWEEEFRSPETKRGLQEIQEAKGVGGVLGAGLSNPAALATMGVETLGPMLAGGGVGGLTRGAATMLPRVSPALTRAAGAIAGAAPSVGEGVIAGAMTEGETSTRLAVAASTAILGRLGGKVAQKFGLADVDSLVTGKVSPSEIARIGEVGRKVLGAGAVEGILEEAPQEGVQAVIENIANGRTWNEGVVESATLGGMLGFGLGAAAQMSQSGAAAPQPEAEKLADPEWRKVTHGKTDADAGRIRRLADGTVEAESPGGETTTHPSLPQARLHLREAAETDSAAPAPVDETPCTFGNGC